jgi:hypothetical protein
MAEQVKVFKNVVDQVVPVTATTVSLHTTSATQRAVIKDIDCLNLGKNVTLDLDGRTMNSGTDAGVLERTKNLIMGPSSTLSLKFPARPATAYKGMMFFYGTEGSQLVEGDGLTAAFYSQTQITSTNSNVNYGTSGAIHVHSTTGVVTYLTLKNGNVKVYEDSTGAEISTYSLGASGSVAYQFCTDGTYLYGVSSGTLIHRKHIESLASTDFAVNGMAIPADNTGAYVVHHNGKLYSKTNGNSHIVTILDIATAVVTSKSANTGTSQFPVGGYSDGAGVLTTTAGVTYIVEQGTNYWYYWNLSTDVVTRVSNGTATSTEYGNGFTQIAPGVALILGEENDRATVIDMNTSPPTWSTTLKPQHDFTLNKTANTYGSSFTIAGGIVPVPARSYTALCAGIDITED